VPDNIDIMLSHKQKKGQNAKNFKPNNPNAGQFTWKNNCTSDKVLEIPLWKNEAGREIPWWDNTNFNNKNSQAFSESIICLMVQQPRSAGRMLMLIADPVGPS
jgi:hypothetical protein